MPFRFMGEQDDPEMEVLLSRGLTRVYDTEARAPDVVPPPHPPQPRPGGALYVWQGVAFVRCGCGRCFTGPCPSPR